MKVLKIIEKKKTSEGHYIVSGVCSILISNIPSIWVFEKEITIGYYTITCETNTEAMNLHNSLIDVFIFQGQNFFEISVLNEGYNKHFFLN